MKNEISEYTELSKVNDICTIENNYAAVEKIDEDVYCNIVRDDLDMYGIDIDRYANNLLIKIEVGKTIKTIIDDNKYYIILSSNDKILVVFKISNVNNKIIEFTKMDNLTHMNFCAETFLLNNTYIINIKY